MNINNTEAIKECFDFLYLYQRHLSASQAEFVQGCKTYFNRNKAISERQLKILREIKKFLPVDTEARYTNNSR